MRNVILYFTKKYKGDWEKIYDALKRKEKIAINDLREIENYEKYNYCSIIDDNYPFKLKEIYKPPFSLFYNGKLDLCNKEVISLFGNYTYEEIIEIKSKFPNHVISLELSNKNKNIIDKLNNNNIEFIAICQTDINEVLNNEEIKLYTDNNLLISEFNDRNNVIFIEQSWLRISMAISNIILIKYKHNDVNVRVGLEIFKMENKKVYVFNDCDSQIASEYNLIDYNTLLESTSNNILN